MATVNAQLFDLSIDHEVDLRRFSVGVVRRMIAVLNRSDAALAAQLQSALDSMDATDFTIERLEQLLASVRALNTSAYNQVMIALDPELKDLANVEAAFQYRMFSTTLPTQVQLVIGLNKISTDAVYAAAMSRPFQGRLLSGWGTNLAASRMTLIRNTVSQGYLQGRTTS